MDFRISARHVNLMPVLGRSESMVPDLLQARVFRLMEEPLMPKRCTQVAALLVRFGDK